MGKWTARHNNRRHLSQAANLIDNAVVHLMEVHESFPESYEKHREFLRVYSVALAECKDELLAYRDSI